MREQPSSVEPFDGVPRCLASSPIALAASAHSPVRKAQLEAEVAELQANYDGWVKVGVLQKVIRCNPGNRPCIRVDESAGQFESQGYAGYRVIWGY